MAEPEAPMELLAQVLEQAREHTAHRRELAAGERPPEPGEVVVLEAAREHPVEWVLVARSPADPELFLALPADGCVLVGSADVALADGAEVGALRLRCRYGVWVERVRLAPVRHTGKVSAGDVARAWAKWQAMANGAAVGTVLEREVDDDPEYQEWLETVVIPACEAVRAAGAVERKAKPSEQEEEKGKSQEWAPVIRLAASIVLVIGAGLATAVLWRQHERIETMLAASEKTEKRHREELARLEAARLRLETERRELEKRSSESAEAERVAREQIAQLDRRIEELKRSATVVNPMLALFDPPGTATVRGKVEVKLEPGASHLMLFVAVLEPSSNARYRLELREKGRAEVTWSNDRLHVEELGEIRAGVPAGLLTVGEYELELAVAEGREFRLVARYVIEVEK